jgi:hypothetical protein
MSDLETLECDQTIVIGDVVHTGSNHFPQWRVIAIDGDKAWVRNVQTHADGVTDLRRCRKVQPA